MMRLRMRLRSSSDIHVNRSAVRTADVVSISMCRVTLIYKHFSPYTKTRGVCWVLEKEMEKRKYLNYSSFFFLAGFFFFLCSLSTFGRLMIHFNQLEWTFYVCANKFATLSFVRNVVCFPSSSSHHVTKTNFGFYHLFVWFQDVVNFIDSPTPNKIF